MFGELEGTDPRHLANMAITLSEWSEKNNYLDEALHALRKAERIYESSFGVMDKKTCKIKRNISLLLLKANKYDEALEELVEVEVL